MPSHPKRLSPPDIRSEKNADRKANGRCRCGSILPKGYATCSSCRRSGFLARLRRKRQGLCTRCGKFEAAFDQTICAACVNYLSFRHTLKRLMQGNLKEDDKKERRDKQLRAKRLKPVMCARRTSQTP